ncbi:MAG: hypothetical protein V4543_16850 [Bacteroidota bacterium]
MKIKQPLFQPDSKIKFGITAVLVVLITVITFYNRIYRYPIKFDDAFISYRIAKNIANGNGAQFNIGERVRANTSLIYPVLSSPAFLLEDKTAILLIDIFDLLCFTIANLLFAALTKKLIEKYTGLSHWSLFPLLFLINSSYASIVTGMETQLLLICIAASALYLNRKQYNTAFLISCAGIFIRPDGVLITFITFIYCLYSDRKRWHWYIIYSASSAAVYFLITFFYYNEILPHTAEVKKVLFPNQFEHLEVFLYCNFNPYDFRNYFGIAYFIGLMVMIRKADSFLVSGILYFCFFTFVGTWFPGFGWYWVPAHYYFVGVEAVGTAWIISVISRFVIKDRLQPISKYYYPAVFILMSVYGFSVLKFNTLLNRNYSAEYIELTDMCRRVGQKLVELKPTKYTIIEPLGRVGFFSYPTKFKDYPGLCSKEVFEVVKRHKTHSLAYAGANNYGEFKDILDHVPDLQFAVLRRVEVSLLEKNNVIDSSQVVFDSYLNHEQHKDGQLLIVKLKPAKQIETGY